MVLSLFIDSISALSIRDVARLIGSYRALDKVGSTNQIDRSRYTPEQLAALEAHMAAQPTNLSKTLDFTISSNFNDEHPNFNFYLQCYLQFERFGTLPFPGSFADQPNQIVEIFQVFQAIRNEEALKEQKKANGRK